ncbi:hypothetical protein B0O80DRAFT_444113 [Mortierella sp. GBAus27b]|nr:hypothetical protein B0O80DRAFT_444113 [Mortierella sp. GBAus27b]
MLQQLQEWVNAIDQGNHLSLDQITGEFTKRQLETLNHQMFIHDHIHALLGDCLRESSIPRLFIVLPKNPNVQGATSGFQVHFLCACGSHTMTKDSKGTHEVHMTNHAGYNLERPKEFFDKYGRYVLSMMYMIKYGAIGSGLVVPPQSRAVAKIQKNLPSTCNIQQLIDATISYLEEVARTTDNDMSAPSHWTLGDVEQEGLKWYLEINKGAHYPGDLYQLVTQEHSSWVCSEHQCEWTVQRLKDVAGTIGGTSTVRPRKLDISVASSAVTMEFLDILAKFSGIQPIKDKPSFTADCERFSLAIEVSQNVQEVVMTIKNLIDLAEGDTDFVQQCNLTKLKISHTPEAGDENRLTIILQQSPHLKELWIGSIDNRVLDIVNLVISVREKMLQNGKPTALQTFELMENGLVTLNFDREWDDANHITATLKFSQGSTKFDMDTRMVLQNGQSEDEGNWICNFFRQYGWSISSLNTATMFNDNLSRLLDNVTQTHGSKLTHLILCPFSITTTGLDAMDRVIKRSQSLDRLRLSLISLDDTSQMEMAELLLERCGARVNELWLYSDTVGPWLQQISNKFSTRSSLPLLDHLVVECVTKQDFPHESIPWLITMVSPLPQSKGTSQQAGKPLMTGLKRFKLSTVTLETQDWESLVNAFDFSVLLELTLYNTNFTQTQLDLMIDRISGTGASVVPLETLDLKETDLLASADKPSLKRRIQQVAPKVATIHGL